MAALAALALLAATTVPTWAALQPNASAPHVAEIHSSAGVSGTASSRLEDPGLRTMLRDLPLMQYQRIADAVSGHTATGATFGTAVREASIARFAESVSAEAILPQLDGALQTKAAAAKWIAVTAEQERVAAERAAAEAAARQRAAASYGSVSSAGAVAGTVYGATITFYDCLSGGFCGNMASGQQVFAGAAACSYNLAIGTRFTIAGDPTGRTYVCLDRGAVAPTWVDVWFYDPADGYAWQGIVGSYGDLRIIQ